MRLSWLKYPPKNKPPSKLICSTNFIKICDHKVNEPYSETSEIPKTYPNFPGQSIYCHPTALQNFVLNYLPNVKFSFVLVSGDSDTTVPTDCREWATIILNHPLLQCWYSQNCVEPSEKLRQLPIGLDLHTLESPRLSRDSQERTALEIKNSAKERISKCHGSFHFFMITRYGDDRKLAVAQIPKELVHYEPTRIHRDTLWQNMVNYKYVISPHGNGLDCHRTWEALVLGCIPIVKSSPLDPLFCDLPVLIVKEWSDITQEVLDAFVPKCNNTEKLELSYWKKLFTQRPS